MIRVFEFENSYIGENGQAVDAEYNLFGYFDGLTMRKFHDNLIDDFYTQFQALQLKRLEKKCDYFDIVGFCVDEIYDEEFWRKGGEPYIFISCVRLKKPSGKLTEIIFKLESRYNGIGYTSVDNSDFIFCIRRENYVDGYKCLKEYFSYIKSIDVTNDIEKLFSVVAISQALLDILNHKEKGRWNTEDIQNAQIEFSMLKEEKISCSLRALIKNIDKTKDFVDALKKNLQTDIQDFVIVGSEDLQLELHGISSLEFLSLYGFKGLLTHDDSTYSNAFYNIKTEIFPA